MCLSSEEINAPGKKLMVNIREFAENITLGDIFYYSDGQGAFKVVRVVNRNTIIVKVLCDFEVINAKSISLPPAVSENNYLERLLLDIKDISPDYIATSFTEDASDIKVLQHRGYKIISKIETQKGLDNIDDILKFSLGIMVARGDMGGVYKLY